MLVYSRSSKMKEVEKKHQHDVELQAKSHSYCSICQLPGVSNCLCKIPHRRRKKRQTSPNCQCRASVTTQFAAWAWWTSRHRNGWKSRLTANKHKNRQTQIREQSEKEAMKCSQTDSWTGIAVNSQKWQTDRQTQKQIRRLGQTRHHPTHGQTFYTHTSPPRTFHFACKETSTQHD